MQEQVSFVRGSWRRDRPVDRCRGQVTEIPPPPQGELAKESIKHGRELFYGAIANCIKCHGDSALGDGEMTDYDDWAKEINDENPAQKAPEYLALGVAEPRLLPPRTIRPRNLRIGVYRGGRRPMDLFLRMNNGIEGTPMPASPSAGLTPEDIWNIVNYVQSLPYEPISNPPGYQYEILRERM